MSNLPPCGACSYTLSTKTLSIRISPTFVGTLSEGRLTLRSSTGAEVVHPIPQRLRAGSVATLRGLTGPDGRKIAEATLGWTVAGDPTGQTSIEVPIAVDP
jgi:hypothetical protein